ncbi:MAG: hypothetical protein WDN06_11555 [Asticcacaulis sp.]
MKLVACLLIAALALAACHGTSSSSTTTDSSSSVGGVTLGFHSSQSYAASTSISVSFSYEAS